MSTVYETTICETLDVMQQSAVILTDGKQMRWAYGLPRLLPWASFQARVQGKGVQADPENFLHWGDRLESRKNKRAVVYRIPLKREPQRATEGPPQVFSQVPVSTSVWRNWAKNHLKGLEHGSPPWHWSHFWLCNSLLWRLSCVL